MTNRPTERRSLKGVGGVSLRGGAGSNKVGGYALKFNKLSQNLGGFVERIDPGFLAKSEGDGWPGVMARWNHEDAYLLGTTEAETLRLLVDGTGLDYEVDCPTTRADLLELVARGDVKRSSFAFIVFDDDWGLTPDGFPMRTLLSGQLVDVAPVNTPAYLDTSTGLRSLAERAQADLAEVRQLAASGDLGRLLTRNAPENSADANAAESTFAPAFDALRRRLELQK